MQIHEYTNPIQYKNFVVPENNQNAPAPNAVIWQKWGYLMSKI
jgi:hypothetical protein